MVSFRRIAAVMDVTHFICPSCGAEIRISPKGCPKCNPPKRKRFQPEPDPWEREDTSDGISLPDDDFDYEHFLAEEFGGGPKRNRKQWLWWATAVALLVAVAWLWGFYPIFTKP
ncbi:MAG: hypothetical protein KA250_13515 [Verrucomicrobiales bacterium]|jgi:hypothetical protein|nr:hypothetical protein [Verrucomicrobiales bacterium]MBP9225150.1 hypothetical protein [Verrucomicrobiales bacterium]HQZ27021.1 hypothetical protein [Verrucomicrobiales bacterium]